MIDLPSTVEDTDARLSDLVLRKRRVTLGATRSDIDNEINALLAHRSVLSR